MTSEHNDQNATVSIDGQLFVDLFAETGQQQATIAMLRVAMEQALECISEDYTESASIILRQTLDMLGPSPGSS